MNTIMIVFFVMYGIVSLACLVLFIQGIRSSLKNGKLKKWSDKKKDKKAKKKLAKDTSKKQIKKHNKKKGEINYQALKFEYSDICHMVTNAVEMALVTESIASEVYILKFDEYYKKKNAYNSKFCDIYSLESFACLIKALIEEPLIRKETSKSQNLHIIENLIGIIKTRARYQNAKLTTYSKSELKIAMQDNFRLYGDDIFLIAMFLVDKLR